MLGFERGENLYLDGNDWDAAYIPVYVRRQPFSLAYSKVKDGKPDPESLVISVDMDSKRIQKEVGEKLFNDDGTHSPFLNSVNDLLAEFGPAVASTKAFIAALKELDLIEPAQLDVQLGSGGKRSFDGLYTLNEEKLSKLEGDKLADMYKRGYLQGAWMLLVSMGNVRKLIVRRAARDEAASQG